MLDTHTCVGGINGIELHMFPDVIADVRYDHYARAWVVDGDGVTPATLDLTEPTAPDDRIIAELYTPTRSSTELGFTADRFLCPEAN